MDYVIVCLIGVTGGGLGVFFALHSMKRRVDEQRNECDRRGEVLRQAKEALNARRESLEEQGRKAKEALEVKRASLAEQAKKLAAAKTEFESLPVSYRELQDENRIIKQDLFNLHTQVQKTSLDKERQKESQKELSQKVDEVGKIYLDDNVKWIGKSLTPNNFSNCKQRLEKVIRRCNAIGFSIAEDQANRLIADLREEYEKIVHAAFEREEQSRIKAQIREEQMREKEIERELKRLEREREAIAAALEKALADAKDEHSAEVEQLRARLKEAEEQSQRTISQAQLTRSGHVYVISNIGSFGESVFKIGMTRRLEPYDRIKELGDASVPFPFDVHAMISSDDAPTLEKVIHHSLHRNRVNKANPRKEYFRTSLEDIFKLVRDHHGEVDYVVDAEALEYRQSMEMDDSDEEFIDEVYSHLENGSDEAS